MVLAKVGQRSEKVSKLYLLKKGKENEESYRNRIAVNLLIKYKDSS